MATRGRLADSAAARPQPPADTASPDPAPADPALDPFAAGSGPAATSSDPATPGVATSDSASQAAASSDSASPDPGTSDRVAADPASPALATSELAAPGAAPVPGTPDPASPDAATEGEGDEGLAVLSPLLAARIGDVRAQAAEAAPRSEVLARITRRSEGPAQARRRPSGRRVLGTVVAVVVLATAVVAAGRAWTSTRDATERTNAALAATRSDIRRTGDDLTTAANDRDAAQATLGDQVAALAARRDARDTAQEGLDVVALLLVQVQGQLQASQTDLFLSAARLGAFNRCLVGVAQALNQASVNDTGGLAATIRRIEGVCAEAGVEL